MTSRSSRTALLALALVPLIATGALADEAKPVAAPAAADASERAPAMPMPMPAFPPARPSINYDGGTAIVNFVARFSDKTVADLALNVQNAVISGADRIRINISSRGGSVHAMHFAVNVLQNLPVPVETVAMSQLASAAVGLFCAGEKRYMPSGSGLYLHQQRGYHQIEDKTAAAIAREYEMSDKFYNELLRNCTNGEGDLSVLDYSSRDTVIDAEQAVALGMVTGPMSELNTGKTWGMAMNIVAADKTPGMGMVYPAYR